MSKLPDNFRERVVVYVNREWPVLNHYQNFTAEEIAQIKRGDRKKPIEYVGKYIWLDPTNWRNELLRYHGSGDYKIYLNDGGVRGNPSLKAVNVCRTIVQVRDDEYPPVIEDLSILDLSDPLNQSFIQTLRSKGVLLPGDVPKGDTEDMASSVAVEKLADALVEQSKQKQAPPVDTNIPAWFTQMLTTTEERHRQDKQLSEERHARELEALTKRMEQQEKVAQERGRDPLETTRAVVEMAKAVTQSTTPAAHSGESQMITLLTQMLQAEKTGRLEELKLAESRHAREMEAINKRLEAQEARAAAVEAARLQQLQQPPTQGKSAIQEAISLVKALKGATEEFNGDTGGGSGNPWVDLATELGPRVLDTIGTVTSAISNRAPAPQQQQPGIQQQPGVAPQPQQQQEPSEVNQMQMYARTIRQPLIAALQNNTPGHAFAGMLIVQYSEAAYQYLVQQGEQGVMQILQSAPEVWGDVQRFGVKVPQFLNEFLDAQAAMQQAERIRQGGRPPVAPVPQSQPSPAARAPQPRTVTVDAQAAPTAGGRTIITGDGTSVKTKPVVNGPVVDGA